MATPINLNRFRKRKAREDGRRKAEENRTKHGLSAADKALQRARQKKADGELAGKKLQAPQGAEAEDDDPLG